LVAFCLILAAHTHAAPQGEDNLRNAVAQSALKNPGVKAAWNAFEAAGHAVRASKGGYLPKLDLTLEAGKERTVDPLEVRESYDVSTYQLVMTQMLFDGFATKQDVARQNYVRLARYYQFRQVAEETALETAQAYLDVLRYQDLVRIAKENYFQHLRYHRDIEGRAKSGIGRGVDLEQAKARLALAESNVLTETTNLHDVSSRYFRLVGAMPSESMVAPEIPKDKIPNQRKKALQKAFLHNPELNASIENIRSVRADFKGKTSPMMPRLDLRVRKQLDENARGFPGEYDEEAVELVLSYNLYNGGSDSARRRQSKSLLYEAFDTRDHVCRKVRQTVSIAYNDIYSKETLIGYLRKNLDAIVKARDAYKNQFDIGQRTLLDLLDTENEFFEVHRALVNARYDFHLAEIRTLAGMGLFLYALNIDGLDSAALDELNFDPDESLRAKCPAEAPQMGSLEIDKSAILRVSPMPIGQREVMQLDIKFKPSSAEITLGSWSEVERAGKFLCDHPKVRGTVEGHTDSVGSTEYNLSLSQARADAVRVALVKACTAAEARLSSIGYGESRPVARNDTELGRATNRRVELVLESGIKGL